ncbi:General vesicular transport factor [Smittium mucronatum]|uniref:General vesicular transport factor n=1 Tax=Smittium mucronatum TaxID=133383 RepID=A0A1R0H5X7_9FUNG|nr:General vesicular transport factor [Smittium mucronatum]
MDFFSRGYNAFVGDGRNLQQTPESAIQKLSDRVATSSLLEDKRAAVLGLKGFTKDFKKLVGEEALEPLLVLLGEEYEDPTLIKSILETLNNLITKSQNDDDHIARLLSLIGDSDFYVKFNALQQLGILFSHSGEALISKILVSPTGVGKLVDLLSDNSEVIRNEGIQLLILMTENNSEIQKILAFENAFEFLFSIIIDEGGVGGNIIVQDCLQLLYNLLSYNISNQKYFRETSCIQRLPDLLSFEPDEVEIGGYGPQTSGWKEQHVRNFLVVLEIVRMLVQHGNTDTFINQKSMQSCGMVSPLLQHSLSLEAPSSIRAQSLAAVGDIIRSNTENQNIFQRILITSTPEYDDFDQDPESAPAPKPHHEPAVLTIFRLAVGSCPRELNEESYHLVRSAAVYLVKSYLEGNKDAQLAIASTFNPPPSDISDEDEIQQSVGSLLVSVISHPFSILNVSETLRVWNSLILFSLLIHENDDSKALALKVIVENYYGNDLSLISVMLKQAVKLSKGFPSGNEIDDNNLNVLLCSQFLSTLCVWLYSNPLSVSLFLKDSDAPNFLIENISRSVSKGFLLQGISSFLFGIIYEFNSSADTPIKNKDLYLIIDKRLGVDNLLLNIGRLNDSKEIHNVFSKDSFDSTSLELDLSSLKIGFSFATLFRMHVNQLKIDIRKPPSSVEANKPPTTGNSKKSENKPKTSKDKSNKKNKSNDESSAIENTKEINHQEFKAKLEEKDKELGLALKKLDSLSISESNKDEKLDSLIKELAELKLSAGILDQKLATANSEIHNLNTALSESKQKIEEMKSEHIQKQDSLSEKLISAENKAAALEEKILSISEKEKTNSSENSSDINELRLKITELEKEQEDLLVLLADQDTTCKNYRKMLREKGEDIPLSDDEDIE